MIIKVTDLKTNEIEEISVTEYTKNSFTITKGRGVYSVEFEPNTVTIEEVKEEEEV